MYIAILSQNDKLYSTMRLKEAAIARKHKIRVINYLQCNVFIEQGKPELIYRGKKLKGIDALIPRIGSSKTFYGSAIVRQFEMKKIFTTAKSIAIVRCRDKLRSLQILSKDGIPMPLTAFSSNAESIDDLIRIVGGPPVIIKILEGTQGKGVVLAETKKSAKSVIETLYGLKANFLIQEFITEAKGADIRAFVIGNKVVAAMKRQGREDDFRSNIHQGGTAFPIKLEKEARQLAVRSAKILGLSIAGVDILPSSKGYLVMEVNSSPGLEGIETTTGIDVADKIISYIEESIQKNIYTKDKVGA